MNVKETIAVEIYFLLFSCEFEAFWALNFSRSRTDVVNFHPEIKIVRLTWCKVVLYIYIYKKISWQELKLVPDALRGDIAVSERRLKCNTWQLSVPRGRCCCAPEKGIPSPTGSINIHICLRFLKVTQKKYSFVLISEAFSQFSSGKLLLKPRTTSVYLLCISPVHNSGHDLDEKQMWKCHQKL